ncbi:hypothetical protein WKR88_23710 [Trinickia caryophylli]|uniref:Uncharacterized membrane protein n=1 Tax=Trinickia caryophylli TaxID=28094 RepID=A0A1X7F4E2_TRICW|nr:hypothetical protein [Trinickia caryophylli]PMS10413.1 hypothetical protein C0Z17_20195 [Trinickia caryophylli]TRX19469.1 hypothetical protein FNF07_15390 [Trinickia caryophylli]WQE13226.1 hypothetical protein U0034_07560 [Trinickia caryophylli]SMF45193.1 Uncharacterized membrane protein [Trinickia caryophylli]GLU34461.1 hypothetical protein Busp01_43030 [Trinickia caryophylli]
MNEDPQRTREPVSYDRPSDGERERSMRTLTHVLYALYALHWFTGGISGLVAIIIDYLKRTDAEGTPYAAHIQWQIRTFWFGVLGYLVGGALVFVAIGFIVIAAVSIWMLYRIVKGWLYLYDNKPLEPQAWF